MIESMLDDDVYTRTVGQFVFHHFPQTNVRYEFINRSTSLDLDDFAYKNFDQISENIGKLSELSLSREEYRYLEDLDLFDKSYLDFLKAYRFDPGQVTLAMREGKFHIDVEGPWAETIMWEVPLLATLSELFYAKRPTNFLDYIDRTKNKRSLLDNVKFMEFGTRRRRSSHIQDEVVRTLKYSPGFLGTSNMHFARLHGTKCCGTQSHQLISGLSAFYPVDKVNYWVMKLWSEFYKGKLGIALSDTFGTNNFISNFDYKYARIFDGVRIDSGSPLANADKFLKHYRKLGIDPRHKTLVFSDGLSPEGCVEIKRAIQGQTNCMFGIGSNLTSDVPGEDALKIVMKLTSVETDEGWRDVVKITDDCGKSSGNPEEIKRIKALLAASPYKQGKHIC